MTQPIDRVNYRLGGLPVTQHRLVGVGSSAICIALLLTDIGPQWLLIVVLVAQVGIGIWMSTGLIEIRSIGTSLQLSSFVRSWTIDENDVATFDARSPDGHLGQLLHHNGLLTSSDGREWTVLCSPSATLSRRGSHR